MWSLYYAKDWKTWNGQCCGGYEGFLVDNYLTLLTMYEQRVKQKDNLFTRLCANVSVLNLRNFKSLRSEITRQRLVILFCQQ